jgi:hypothetical protein
MDTSDYWTKSRINRNRRIKASEDKSYESWPAQAKHESTYAYNTKTKLVQSSKDAKKLKTTWRHQLTRRSPERRLKYMSDMKYDLTFLILKSLCDLQTNFVSTNIGHDLYENTNCPIY